MTMIIDSIREILVNLLGTEYGRGFVVFFAIALMLTAPLWLFLIICYVLYKPRKRIKLQHSSSETGEKPLAVLRYEWWRIAWTLYIPLVPAMTGCAFFTFSPLTALSLPKVIFLKVFSPLGLIGSIWLLMDMLLMKDVRLYRDKIVKSYRLLTTKEAYPYDGNV